MPTVTVPLSAAQLANAQRPEVWLDDEAQAELGQVIVSGSRLVGDPQALAFMADNAMDHVIDSELVGSVADSFQAIARRIRFAMACPGARYSTAAANAALA